MAGLPQDDSVRWLDISIAQIVQIFKEHGISISPYIARKMVKLRGFKKRSFHKTKTLKEVKNRDAQFKLLEATWISCVRLGIPVLSIDTKKKEMLGNLKRAGKTFSCQELAALDHDFVSFSNGTIIPYGIYDVERNVGYLTIGNSHDTAEFVCDNIARIWKDYLQWEYPKATSICILCDGGGSNSASHHVFQNFPRFSCMFRNIVVLLKENIESRIFARRDSLLSALLKTYRLLVPLAHPPALVMPRRL